MFKNLIAYRIGEGWATDAQQLAEQLAKEPFLPCAPTQPLAVGWAPPRGIEHAPLVEVVDGHWLVKLKREVRLLPSSVVQERVDELAEHIEETTGRKPGKKAKKDLKEQAQHELLPRAFTKTSATQVWIAPQQRLLFVDAGSSSRAAKLPLQSPFHTPSTSRGGSSAAEPAPPPVRAGSSRPVHSVSAPSS